MLYAYFYTISLVFRYTSWHFYAFSVTNLLTRCYSASFLFSAIFVFQKSYIENILRIGRNKSQTSRYLPKLPESRRGDEEDLLVGHTTRGCGLGLAHAPPPVVSPTRTTSDTASSPIKSPRREKPKDPITFSEYIMIHHRR
jgi:hypothetical protein